MIIKPYIQRILILVLGLLPLMLAAQAPLITGVLPLSANVEKNGKFEARVVLQASYKNPYDYDEIRVTATFTDPDGQQFVVEGFFMEAFNLAGSGQITPNTAQNGFRIRFSPRKTGTWTYVVTCETPEGKAGFPPQSFQCLPVNVAHNKGFVKMGTGNYLVFENGEQYIPIGENIAWPVGNAYLDYQKWVGALSANGGNFFRLWLCHWGLGLEWKDNVSGYSGLKKYKQSSAFYLDWLFEHCTELGVYVQFCLNHHGQISSQVNPNWNENPYNAANGGPCQQTWDFFSNQQAKALHKNRLRYILARWGCQRSIMTWELFNEVNWTDNYEQHKGAIADWHADMAAFLKQNDPVQRPISTSYGNPQSEDPAVWNNPDMDYTQRHYYFDSPNLEAVLVSGLRENLQQYDKPVHIGEFGLLTENTALKTLDPNGIHVHNNLWGPLFGGGVGTGMGWWWDSYFDPQQLYRYFNPLATLTAQMPLAAKNFRPLQNTTVSGAAGDLKLNATLDWAGLGDTLLEVSPKGVNPTNYKLGKYLYGSVWNTQYRRPPVFKTEWTAPGQFRIMVGNQFGNSPRLAVWLDGIQVLLLTPTANQNIMLEVPAGKHTIKVDNLGTDWMTIACYSFSGLGSALDAYVLCSSDQSRAAGWLLNSDYNHQYVRSNGAPDAINGAKLRMEQIANGQYFVKWFDCQTGSLVQTDPLMVANGVAEFSIPEIVWDLAFVLDAQPAKTAEATAAMPLSVFPNPIAREPLNLAFDLARAENVVVLLCDAGGRVVQSLYTALLPAGSHQVTLALEPGLSAGVYWIHVAAGKERAAKPIGIVR